MSYNPIYFFLLCRSDIASSLTVKSVALLLESAKRAEDYKTGATIYQELSSNLDVCLSKKSAKFFFHSTSVVSFRNYCWLHQIATLIS